MTLEELIPLTKAHDADWLVKNHPGPFLLRARSSDELNPPAVGVTQHNLPSVKRLTAVGQEMTLRPQSMGGVGDSSQSLPIFSQLREANLPRNFEVHTVLKSTRNSFTTGVTIGRTSNNDIILPSASISKFHAWIERESPSLLKSWIKGAQERFLIHDAKSSFGTLVDGVKVEGESGQGLALRPGAKIRMGDVSLTFLDAEGLHRWISAKLALLKR